MPEWALDYFLSFSFIISLVFYLFFGNKIKKHREGRPRVSVRPTVRRYHPSPEGSLMNTKETIVRQSSVAMLIDDVYCNDNIYTQFPNINHAPFTERTRFARLAWRILQNSSSIEIT